MDSAGSLAVGKGRLAPDRYAKQRGLQAANALSSTLLFGVILVAANYLAARHYSISDLTSNRINSLSAQTRQTLAQFPAPVTLTYVYAPRDRNGQPPPGATALLNSYASVSDKVRVEFVNAVVDPLRLQTLALSAGRRVLEWGQPVIVAQMASAPAATQGTSTQKVAQPQRQEILVADEQNITSGLRRLLNSKPRTLYFLTGHGELELNQPVFATARQALQAQNYTLRSTRLADTKGKTQDGVPNDAAALIVIAPQSDPDRQRSGSPDTLRTTWTSGVTDVAYDNTTTALESNRSLAGRGDGRRFCRRAQSANPATRARTTRGGDAQPDSTRRQW
jgi:hypothetical protein